MLNFLLRFFIQLGKRFINDRFTYSASALTFTTLLSLVPTMSVSIAVFSILPVSKQVTIQVEQFIFANFVPATGQIVMQYLQYFVNQTAKLSFYNTIFLVITAFLTIITVERSLNDVWKVPHRRHGLRAYARYLAILILAPVLIILSIAATSYILSLPIVKGAANVIGLESTLLAIIPFLLSMIGLTLAYVILPNCKVPIRDAVVGAVIASFIFEIAKQLFVLYLLHFPTYQLLYGAFAAFPLFLIWIYFSWVIILFGALVVNVLTESRRRDWS